jgi:5-methyltetrahydropteroyltriglutamate--homocysteine methyltransferase
MATNANSRSSSAGPFRYASYAVGYLEKAQRYAHVPVKQAVISASALSLLYPQDGVPGYSRDAFVEDLLREHETDIRRCLERGAHNVQIDFTEGRLAVKLDPSKGLLKSFVDLNNRVLARFSDAERSRIGVHTCPGGDQDSTHSADVDYVELLPSLFQLQAGNFYLQLASEKDTARVLKASGNIPSRIKRSLWVLPTQLTESRNRGTGSGQSPRSRKTHPARSLGFNGRLRVFAFR